MMNGRPSWAPWIKFITNYSNQKNLLYHKPCYMATHYLIKKESHSFLTQQLNIFYPLKDSRSLLFSNFPTESLNLFRSFLKRFIIFNFTCSLILLYFFYFYLFPGILKCWCLVTVTFKFTVLYNNICRKKRFIRNKSIQDSWILLIIIVNNIRMYRYYFSNF